MPKTREISLEERPAMLAEYKSGTPLKTLANKYNCHINTILYQARKQKMYNTVRNVGIQLTDKMARC